MMRLLPEVKTPGLSGLVLTQIEAVASGLLLGYTIHRW